MSEGSVGVIEDNLVSGSKKPGIAVNGSTALKLNRNKVTGVKETPGFTIVNGAVVREMIGNAADSNRGPRFMLKGGTIVETGLDAIPHSNRPKQEKGK